MQHEHYLKREFDALMADPSSIRFLDEGALDGLWYWDLENPDHEWMSPGFWRTLGFNPDDREHLAAEWQDLIFPEDGQRALENFQRHCADPNHPYDQIVRYRTGYGGTVTIRCRGLAIRRDGVPVRMLGAHTVIHDSRKAEMERRLSDLIYLSGDAIMAWSLTGGIKRWNRGAEIVYGHSKTAAMGQDPNRLLAARYDDGWDKVLAVLEDWGEWSGDVHRKDRDGKDVVTSSVLHRAEIHADDMLILQIDRNVTALRHAEQVRELLARELDHRVKNLMAVVTSIVSMSAVGQKDPTKLAEAIKSRVKALSAAHSLSFEEAQHGAVGLEDMASAILTPFHSDEQDLSVSGDPVTVPQRQVTPLSMILHELATNAVKYGAWCRQEGKVSLDWSLVEPAEAQQIVELSWRETGSDTATAGDDGTSGFGTRLIDMSARQLGGTVVRDWRAEGLSLTLRFPLQTLDQ
ncbi:MAG: HWE histidine kinase domain-containing protein [Pseudomonadota bacterium]